MTNKSEDEVKVCHWWMEHPKLKGVRTAVLVESLYSSSGELAGGGFHSVGLQKIGFSRR